MREDDSESRVRGEERVCVSPSIALFRYRGGSREIQSREKLNELMELKGVVHRKELGDEVQEGIGKSEERR